MEVFILEDTRVRLPKIGEILFVLAIFMFIMTSSVIWFDLPFQLSMFVVWFVFIFFGIYLGYGYGELQSSIASGIHKGLEALFITITVGALIGTWIAGGIVPSIIYYGLSIIHPNIFLLATLIICSITSLVTGTSFGTVGTAGIAMMGIGASFGFPLPLVAGAVVSGAYFGDKLSPVSDTTILTSSLCEVDIMSHIKSMLHVSIPSYIIAGGLFTIVGFFYTDGSFEMSSIQNNMNALTDHFNISWYMLIPLIIVLILLTMNKPAVPTIAFGALLGVIWTALFQGSDVLSALKTAYFGPGMESGNEFINLLLNRGGIESMLDVVIFIMLALGFGGLMEKTGIITVVGNLISRWVKNSTGRLSVSTIVSAFFGNLFGSAGYVSLITGSKMTVDNYDRLKIQRRVLSRNTEAGGTLTAAMVPWNENAIYMSAVLGVSTLAYLPFLWLAFISIAVAIIYGYTGLFMWKVEDGESEKAEEVEEREAKVE